MPAAASSYYRPTTVAEAQSLVRRLDRAAFLAGGTALLARRNPKATALIDLGGLGLAYIREGAHEQGEKRIEIGAMTTLQAMTTSPLLAEFAGGLLAKAAHDTATRTVRNTATVGGSIAGCSATTDVVVALLALRAEIITASGRILTLEDVLAERYAVRRPRLITELHIYGAMEGTASAFCRVARLPSDQAIANVAAVARMADGVCISIRLGAGGVAAKPVRLRAAEAALIGTRLESAALDRAAEIAMQTVQPQSDILGSAEYRRAMLSVLVKRAVAAYREQIGGREP